MPPRALIALLALLAVDGAFAQTTVDVGAAVGQQSYQSRLDDPRTLTSLEVVGRRGPIGLEFAVEYADLSQEGALFVIHPDVIYRWELFSSGFAVVAGGGPSVANVGGSGGGLTWNVEVELEKRFGRAALFGRVRRYDYGLPRFREGEAGPDGPAIYAGLRFTVAGPAVRR